jgi:hypothetical protein
MATQSKNLFILMGCFCAFFCGGLHSALGKNAAIHESDDPTWPTIAAGIFESLDQSQLKCEFTYQRGVAMSAADAAAGKFVVDDGATTDGSLGKGLLVKYQKFSRYRVIYDTPTDYNMTGKSGSSVASNDASGGSSVFITYYPKQQNLDQVIVGGNGNVFRDERIKEWWDLEQLSREMRYSGLNACLKLPKVAPLGSFQATPLKSSRVLSHVDTAMVIEVESENEEKSVVHVDLSSRYPTVTKIIQKYQISEFSEFETLDSGLAFPKRHVVVSGPFDVNTPQPFWIGHLWNVTSLTSEVKESDFDVEFVDEQRRNQPWRTSNAIQLSRPDQDPEVFDNVNKRKDAR